MTFLIQNLMGSEIKALVALIAPTEVSNNRSVAILEIPTSFAN
jgi:hypothetical protein